MRRKQKFSLQFDSANREFLIIKIPVMLKKSPKAKNIWIFLTSIFWKIVIRSEFLTSINFTSTPPIAVILEKKQEVIIISLESLEISWFNETSWILPPNNPIFAATELIITNDCKIFANPKVQFFYFFLVNFIIKFITFMTRVPPPFTWNKNERSSVIMDIFKLHKINLDSNLLIKIWVFENEIPIPNNSGFEEIVTFLVIWTIPNVSERFLLEEVFENCILKERSELFAIFDKASSKEEKITKLWFIKRGEGELVSIVMFNGKMQKNSWKKMQKAKMSMNFENDEVFFQ